MKSYNILLILFLLFSCASSQKTKEKKMAKVYTKKGTSELIVKNYTEALNSLTQANSLDPSNDEILNNLGMAYYFKRNTPKALVFIKKAVLINPKNIDAKMNMATIYMNSGDHRKAEEIYLASIKTDLKYKGHFRTYYNLAMIEEARGNESKMIEYLNNSIAENDFYCPAHFKLGQIEISKNSYRKALEHFKSSSSGSCQREAIGHYYQAVTHLKLRQYQSAKFKFEEIITRFPETNYGKKAEKKLASFQSIVNQPSRVNY